MAEQKTLGILGGMGPMATVDLFQKVVAATKAERDQDHIHILIDNCPSIPDRRTCIIEGRDDAGREMVNAARRLEQAGAEVLIIGCNTAHFFHPMVAEGVSIPVLHMPRETAKVIKAQGFTSACILGTDMTFRTGLYHKALEAEGITPMGLDEEGQQIVLDLIYKGVKAGNADYPVEPSLKKMREAAQRGAQCFILGCTELPIAFAGLDTGLELIDPTDILARAAVRACGYETAE